MVTGERGQSEVLGTALLLGITVLSIALIVTIAGSALDSTNESTNIESAEHAMSQLDSRAALVALGRTDSQSVSMGRARSGSYHVDEDAGWINITHVDYTHHGDDQTLYNESLGALVYENDGQQVAYQGGGVWRKGRSGGSVLVSPPEFHYRGETLTIPIIRVRSPTARGGASGDVTASLRRGSTVGRIYPDKSATYGVNSSRSFQNPILNGSIRVTVHSEYYQAWGSFFRSRTEGNVSVYDVNQTAVVDLTVPSVKGDFKMPLDGDSIKLRGIEGHAVDDLNITLAPDDTDSANFANLKWSLYAEDGSEKLELHIRSGSDMKCDTVGDTTGAADATVYYTDGSGVYQGWTKQDAFPVVCNDLDGDGDPDARVVANWSKPIAFTYSSLSNSDLLYYNPSGSLQDPVTFDHHQSGVSWEPVTYNSGSTAPVNGTVSHYAAFFGPTLEFTVADSGGGGGTVNEDASTGSVDYSGGTAFVTYIHATENNLNVTLTG